MWVIEGSGKDEHKVEKWFEAVAGEDGAATQQEAEHIIAAKALFGIDPKQPLYRVMPPVFKERWLRWEAQAKEAATVEKEEMKEKEEAHFAAILGVHEATHTNLSGKEKGAKQPSKRGKQQHKKPKTEADFAAAAPRANPRESEALLQQASHSTCRISRLIHPVAAVRTYV